MIRQGSCVWALQVTSVSVHLWSGLQSHTVRQSSYRGVAANDSARHADAGCTTTVNGQISPHFVAHLVEHRIRLSQMRVGQKLKLATAVRRKSRQEFFTLKGWHDEHVAVSSEACGMEHLSGHARLNEVKSDTFRSLPSSRMPLEPVELSMSSEQTRLAPFSRTPAQPSV